MAKTGLNMARNLKLPEDDAPTQTYGFIARKGAGKTYAAGVLVEELLSIGAPVAVLDPIGNWWGLRLKADGKRAGVSIAVLGGNHGDMPLSPDAGGQVADVLVDHLIPLVIDISLMSNSERKRFVTAFAERLLQRAKTKMEPIMVVLEEAQLFAPQRVMKGEERMLGAVEKIVRLGRNYGLGSTLISQRPQSIHKEVLNQVEVLFVGQINGAHERKAISEWVTDQSFDRSVVNELPKLPVGTMMMWSPQWLGKCIEVKIRKKKTFDASSTPKLGKKRAEHKKLADVDVGALETALEESLQLAKENDPELLRREIADLKREIAMITHEKEEAEAGWQEASGYVQQLKDDNTQLREKLAEVGGVPASKEMAEMVAVKIADVREEIDLLENRFAELRGQMDRFDKPGPIPRDPVPYRNDAKTGRSAAPRKATPTGSEPHMPQIKAGARRMVNVCATFYPGTMTKRQIASAARMRVTSGTFSTYWSIINREGLIEEVTSGRWRATKAGLDLVGADLETPMRTLGERIEFWNTRLKAGARRMLSTVRNAAPITKEALAEEVDMSSTSGTFSTYLGMLTNNHLIDKNERGEYVLHQDLVSGGRS